MKNTVFVILFIILGIATIVAYQSMFIVTQTQLALVLEFGKPKDPITEPGLKWKVPFIQTVDYFDKRVLDLETEQQEVTAADQKRLVVDAFARYRIVNPLLFYQTLNNEDRARSQLGPLLGSAMRGVLGTASFSDVVRNKRDDLMRQIAKQVNGEATAFGIEIVDVRIKRADLPEANSMAIFGRMKTEREQQAAEIRAEGVEAAKRINAEADRKVTVLIADAKSQAEITQGEGDAERNRIYAEAFGKDPDFFIFYRSMQAYEEGLKSGDTRMVLSPDSDFFRYFNSPSGRHEGTARGDKEKAQEKAPESEKSQGQ
jgi:modulator of FtsH protease HflC